MRYLIITASYPFLILGFIWQFIAGSFYAGRIVSTHWISRSAQKRVAAAVRAEIDRLGPQAPAASQPAGPTRH